MITLVLRTGEVLHLSSYYNKANVMSILTGYGCLTNNNPQFEAIKGQYPHLCSTIDRSDGTIINIKINLHVSDILAITE